MKHVLLPLAAAVLALVLVLQLRPEPDVVPPDWTRPADASSVEVPTSAIATSLDPEVEDIAEARKQLETAGLPTFELERGTLCVRVVRQDTRPVEHVDVIVGPFLVGDARLEDRTGTTDREGLAKFVLPAGKWKVRCGLSGLKDNLEVVLAAGETIATELVIPVEPTVRGLVNDERGNPVAGAQVLVLGLGTASIARIGTRTDASGQFELPGIGAGRDIAAVAEGFAPSAPRRIELADPLAPTITLVLTRDHGFVTGRVTDRNGNAVPEALVWFGPVDSGTPSARPGPPAQVVRCDAAGRFTSPALAPGDVEVRTTAPKFALTVATTVVEPGLSTELHLQLGLGARVHGTVRMPDGKPAVGAIVWSGVHRAMGSRLALAAVDGSFVLDSLPARPVELTAVAVTEENKKQTTLFARTLVTPSVGDDLSWDPVLAAEPRGAVSGRVETQNGTPLGGWLVVATLPGKRGGKRTNTSPDGGFLLSGLPTGARVALTVHNPTAGLSSFADAALAEVEVDGPEVRVSVQQPPTDRSSLLGTVVGEDGRPLSATLRIWHQNGAAAQYATRLDGSFRIDGVPAGLVHIEVRAPDHPALRLEPRECAAGAIADLGTLTLVRGGLAHGRVLVPAGTSLGNATIRLIDEDDREVAVADCTDGGYRTEWLRAGRYDLLIQADGMAPARARLEIQAGQDRELDVQLTPGALHRFRVQTRDAADQERQCSVIVFDGEKRAIWVAHLPMSRGIAEFRAWLPPGELGVTALGMRGARADASFSVGPPEDGMPGLTELELRR